MVHWLVQWLDGWLVRRSARWSVGRSVGKVDGSLSPRGLGLRPERTMSFWFRFLLSFSFFCYVSFWFLSFSAPFFLPLLSSFSGVLYVRTTAVLLVSSRCNVASGTGWYTAARYSTVLLAYWYCCARVVFFVFFHRGVFLMVVCLVTTG